MMVDPDYLAILQKLKKHSKAQREALHRFNAVATERSYYGFYGQYLESEKLQTVALEKAFDSTAYRAFRYFRRGFVFGVLVTIGVYTLVLYLLNGT